MLIGVSENRTKRRKRFGFVLMVCGLTLAIGPIVGYFLIVLIATLFQLQKEVDNNAFFFWFYLFSLLWSVYVPVGSGIFFLGKWLHDTHVLPRQLRMGDRLVDDGGQWVVASQPHTSVGGTIVSAKVHRVGQPTTVEERSWEWREKIRIKRGPARRKPE